MVLLMTRPVSGHTPTIGNGHHPQNGNGAGHSDRWTCSPKQQALIVKIVAESAADLSRLLDGAAATWVR